MDVCTITQDAFFVAPPHEVFDIFTDARAHTAMSGGERAEIDARVGGRVRAFEGAVTAVFREIADGRRIAQIWRDRDWPEGHFAQLELHFLAVSEGRGTQVHMTLSGVPASKARQTANGWRDYYWVPIADHLRDAKLRPARRFLLEFKNRANLDAVDETWAEDSTLHLGSLELAPARGPQKSVGRIRVSWTGNHIYRIADGRIAEAWSEVSLYELLSQLTEVSH